MTWKNSKIEKPNEGQKIIKYYGNDVVCVDVYFAYKSVSDEFKWIPFPTE